MVIMTKEIALTHGKVALVDDMDYKWLSRHKWYAKWDGYNWYARRRAPRGSNGPHTLHMHREIIGAIPGIRVDHRDNDGLNNQRSNLRQCTNVENLRNRGPQADNTSGYKGVSWKKANHKWTAQITFDGKRLYLGLFITAEEAALAYNVAALELFGEFAYLNQLPRDDEDFIRWGGA